MRNLERRCAAEKRTAERTFKRGLLNHIATRAKIPGRILRRGSVVRMPFGKYRGLRLQDLDDGYLGWLRATATLDPPLRFAVEREWQRRFTADRDDSPDIFGELDSDEFELLRELIALGHRVLALRCHPDRGGDGVKMRRLNNLMDKLRRMGALAA